MPIKAVIFDWGDVYLDWKHKFWKTVAKRLNVEAELLEKEIKKHFKLLYEGKIPDNDFWKNVGEGLKIKIPGESEGWIEERFDTDFSVNKNVESIVRNLREHGYKTALLSNTEKTSFEYGKKHGWTKYFDFIVASCEHGVMKPDLEIFSITLKKIGERPEDCIFIDDKKTFVDAAKELGIKGIQFDNHRHNIDYLKEELIKLGVKKEALYDS